MNTPNDYKDPSWEKTTRWHDWKAYVPESIQKIWHEFPDSHKKLISEWAQKMSREEEPDRQW